jgi:hypothetical protein
MTRSSWQSVAQICYLKDTNHDGIAAISLLISEQNPRQIGRIWHALCI